FPEDLCEPAVVERVEGIRFQGLLEQLPGLAQVLRSFMEVREPANRLAPPRTALEPLSERRGLPLGIGSTLTDQSTIEPELGLEGEARVRFIGALGRLLHPAHVRQ